MRVGIAALLIGCSIDANVARQPVVVVADASVDAVSGRCPRKPGTATMIDLGDVCIDATETTRKEYATFLASGPKNVNAFLCAGNDFTLRGDFTCTPDKMDLTRDVNDPVVCVDWCDAAAYCAWAGKRLCGAIGGGRQDIDDLGALNDVNKSEWYLACAGGEATPRKYPYRGDWAPDRCVDKATDRTAPVGSKSECHGPPGTAQAAVYDLSGNVYEWVDSCQVGPGDPLMQSCLTRGGFFAHEDSRDPWLACAVTNTPLTLKNTRPRSAADHHIGIRCCAR